jgi:hypothetical protein
MVCSAQCELRSDVTALDNSRGIERGKRRNDAFLGAVPKIFHKSSHILQSFLKKKLCSLFLKKRNLAKGKSPLN